MVPGLLLAGFLLGCGSREPVPSAMHDAAEESIARELRAEVELEANVLSAQQEREQAQVQQRMREEDALDTELANANSAELNATIAVGLAEDARLRERQRVEDVMKPFVAPTRRQAEFSTDAAPSSEAGRSDAEIQNISTL